MILYNVYDEYNRLKEVNFIMGDTAHYNIKTLSYLCVRNIMKRGTPDTLFGLELIINEENNENNSKICD